MPHIFTKANKFIRDYVMEMDKEHILGIDQEEIQEDVENEFFSLLADRISEEQAKEIQNLDSDETQDELEEYIIKNITYYGSFIKDAVNNVIKFYQEDYQEAMIEEKEAILA